MLTFELSLPRHVSLHHPSPTNLDLKGESEVNVDLSLESGLPIRSLSGSLMALGFGFCGVGASLEPGCFGV